MTFSFNSSFFRELSIAKREFPQLTYTDIINTQLICMQLKFSDRLESRFYDKTNNVLRCFRKLTGRKRMKYEQEVHTIAIFSNELENVQNLNFRLTDFEIKNVEFENKCLELLKSLQREIEKCRSLENEREDILMKSESLQNENSELKNY